jgi:hypothetical protein
MPKHLDVLSNFRDISQIFSEISLNPQHTHLNHHCKLGRGSDLAEDGSKGAPSDLKMLLENERAEEERVSRGQASERAVCVCSVRWYL